MFLSVTLIFLILLQMFPVSKIKRLLGFLGTIAQLAEVPAQTDCTKGGPWSWSMSKPYLTRSYATLGLNASQLDGCLGG